MLVYRCCRASPAPAGSLPLPSAQSIFLVRLLAPIRHETGTPSSNKHTPHGLAQTRVADNGTWVRLLAIIFCECAFDWLIYLAVYFTHTTAGDLGTIGGILTAKDLAIPPNLFAGARITITKHRRKSERQSTSEQPSQLAAVPRAHAPFLSLYNHYPSELACAHRKILGKR